MLLDTTFIKFGYVIPHVVQFDNVIVGFYCTRQQIMQRVKVYVSVHILTRNLILECYDLLNKMCIMLIR